MCILFIPILRHFPLKLRMSRGALLAHSQTWSRMVSKYSFDVELGGSASKTCTRKTNQASTPPSGSALGTSVVGRRRGLATCEKSPTLAPRQARPAAENPHPKSTGKIAYVPLKSSIPPLNPRYPLINPQSHRVPLPSDPPPNRPPLPPKPPKPPPNPLRTLPPSQGSTLEPAHTTSTTQKPSDSPPVHHHHL